MAPLIAKNKDRINAAITSLSEAGYSYQDPLQFGFDKNKQMHLLDFSNASKMDRDGAIRENFGLLQSFYHQFGMSGEGERIGRVHSLLEGVKSVVVDKLDLDWVDEGVRDHVPKILSQLGNKVPQYAYYATNGRHIGLSGIAQTETTDRLKIILSDRPLDEKDMATWEITRVIHPAKSGDKLTGNAFTANDRWRYQPNPTKVKEFQKWLRTQLSSTLRGQSEEQLWQEYIMAGFRKGAGRAFEDTTRTERALASVSERGPDFYHGTREEFLRSAFGRPVAVEKVKLLAGRAYDDLEGVTSEMSTRMSRVLTDGLVQGKSPRDIARDMTKQVDISRDRALTVARSELIRAHASGQLEALEQLGVEEVGVAVEWSTTGDDAVCPLCSAMEGVVLKLAEAEGMIPRHPNCRCSFIPSNVGEDEENQKRSQSAIETAIRAASRPGKDDDEEGEDWGPGAPISKDRPESILNANYTPELLAFSRWVTEEGNG